MESQIDKFNRRLEVALRHEGSIIRRAQSPAQTEAAQTVIESLRRTKNSLQAQPGQAGWDSLGQATRQSARSHR